MSPKQNWNVLQDFLTPEWKRDKLHILCGQPGGRQRFKHECLKYQERGETVQMFGLKTENKL